jgi:hypothetical protein
MIPVQRFPIMESRESLFSHLPTEQNAAVLILINTVYVFGTQIPYFVKLDRFLNCMHEGMSTVHTYEYTNVF